MSVDWGLAGSTTLSGLAIVFIALIILILAVMITGKIVNSVAGKSGASTPSPKAAAPKLVPPAVQTGIEEETVAAISAAVYSCLDAVPENKGVSYAIKSISRAAGGRPVWGFAGMQQNTRPF